MELLIYLLLDALVGGLFLWLAARITSVDLSFRETVMAAGAAALASLVPGIGWVLSLVVLFVLLKKFSQADIWPDILLMVIISRLVAFVTLLALFGL
ncbi:hypothetical protein HG264_10000 [Pseudomonas sp. gcc21]|uniref:hypothetical protein n=1 Tax=Pseudomonas sp. gcc21 TaxID=2726989 RepID=UPI001452779F|nr:hypothetical protein [Pseudomonas sp. gcc21]QJD59214.1 hypothetical protein HG264_10000 [Pseudomonas sp. gcc21]